MKLLVSCAALLLSACQVVPIVGLTPRYGPVELDGEIGVSSQSTVVTSTTDALGIEEDDGVLSPRVDFSWGGFDTWASWYDARFAGTGTAEGQIDLGGTVIAAGEPTDSELDILLGTSGLTYDFVPGETFDLGVGLGVGYVDFDANITSLTSGESVQSAESFFMPLGAVRAAWAFSTFELSAVVTGFAWKVDEDEVEVFYGDAKLSWKFLHAVDMQGGLVVGYRLTSVSANYEQDDSTFDTELDFAGPYAGLTIQL
jgi:hypothetical protein